MSIPANYLKTSFSYKNILKIQTWVIPCQQFVNYSVFPDLNFILLLTFRRNKFPHKSSTIKIYFALYKRYMYNREKYVSLCLSVAATTQQVIRMVAWNFGSDFKMFMGCAVPNVCSSCPWEQRVRDFYPTEWWVKVQGKRNRCRYISSQILAVVTTMKQTKTESV